MIHKRFEKCQECGFFRSDLLGEECQRNPNMFNPEQCPIDETRAHLERFQNGINEFGDRLEKLHDDYWDMLKDHENFLKDIFRVQPQR